MGCLNMPNAHVEIVCFNHLLSFLLNIYLSDDKLIMFFDSTITSKVTFSLYLNIKYKPGEEK